MLSHFIKMFLRTSWKRGIYSVINLTGLVAGMTAFTLIGLYTWHEQSFDNFHGKKDRIFRVRQDRYTGNELTRQWTAGPWGIGPELKRDFPEVVRYASVNRGGTRSNVLSNGSIFFREEKIFFASEDLFKLFSYPLIEGVDSLVLKRPFTMVVSESLAKRYFGNANPVGKTLKNNGREEYEITGVFKDVPANSHLRFDALFSFESLLKILGPEQSEDLMSSWGWAGNYTYIELAPLADAQAFEAKLPAYVDKEAGEVLRSWGERMAFVLQPVPSIHLYSDHKDELEPNGDGRSVQLLIIIAIFVLVMAWINYVNLATARSLERAKEVGIRKVLGSHRAQLILQFLFESFFVMFVALCITALVISLVLPHFSTFVNRALDFSAMLNRDVWIIGVLFFLTGVVCSGLYPAVLLSGFKPVSVLKGRLRSSTYGVWLRKGLVTFQFVTSIVLLTITFTVYRQLQFMQNSPLGIDTEHILVIHRPDVRTSGHNTRQETFRQSLLSHPGIAGMTASSDVPGRAVNGSNGGVRLEGEDMTRGNSYRVVTADEDFADTYGMKLASGRWFSRDIGEHWKSAVVNETAMRVFGFSAPEDIIGKRIYVWGELLQVIGVVEDYHQETLKKKVDQLIFVCDKEAADYHSVKIRSGQALNDVIAEAEHKYKAAFPGNPFHYFFIDDYFNQQYRSDRQFGKVFGLFTLLAMMIACLGLFGLSSYLVAQRTGEISIRKVLGATVKQITVLVSKEFMMVVLIATLVSWPLSYLFSEKWLSGFAYRIDWELTLFVVPAVCALVLTMLTVASQSLGAALTNPVDNLRDE